MNRFFILIFLVAILLAACEEAAPPTATDTRTPRPLPSMTATPTKILTPTLDFTSTNNPTIASIATDDAARITQVAPFGNTCPLGEILRNISPGDEWTFCDGLNHDITVLNNQGQKWSFSYEHEFGSSMVDIFTNLFHWSLEEHFLYFAPMAIIDPDRVISFNSMALFRMDLSTGKVQTVLPAHGTATLPRFYALSISPIGRKLAYIMQTPMDDPAEIVILDLRSGETRSIHPGADSENVGWFTWSEDGTKMTYMVFDPAAARSYYFTYNLLTFELIPVEPFGP